MNDLQPVVVSALIDAKLAQLPARPGVYRMFDAESRLLYVGKAKNLRNRVRSYFRGRPLDGKTMAMVGRIADLDITLTPSETEALLLEQNLIKAHHPPYNIELRDGKSYPFIRLSGDTAFPRLSFYRGARKTDSRYFGPYPSAAAVRESLGLLQKMFRIRQCEESIFRNRSRPCLQYQIGRCSAPCVGLIDSEAYQQDMADALLFLQGRSSDLIDTLANRMEQAATALDYERAARLRDQIAQLKRMQAQQVVVGDGGDADVLAAHLQPGGACVTLLSIRNGQLLGSQSYFPRAALVSTPAELLSAFIPQFYLDDNAGRAIPPQLLLSDAPDDQACLTEVLSSAAGHAVTLRSGTRGQRARWIDLALENARQQLTAHLANRLKMAQRFEALRESLGLTQTPQRIECFDISHTSGEQTVASCVLFTSQGALKSDYRRFNISDITPGDDYAAMQQALTRRYVRLKRGEEPLPDLLLIDGGKGQLRQAREVLAALGITGVMLLGIAKGTSRKPGLETLLFDDGSERTLPAHDPALHLLQQIRDEAHRFAITGHRQRRKRNQNSSPLELIEGIGPKRRRELLRHFGGIQGLERAGIAELTQVPGINRPLAERIFNALHRL